MRTYFDAATGKFYREGSTKPLRLEKPPAPHPNRTLVFKVKVRPPRKRKAKLVTKTKKTHKLKRVEDHEERKELARRKKRLHDLAKTRKLTTAQYRELYGEDYLENLTLKEIKRLHNDAFSIIRDHSRKRYVASGRPKACLVCGYNFAVDIHHVKPVGKFKPEATINQVNDIENLVALCKNHHHEADRAYRFITNTWYTTHYDFFETSVVGW